MSTELIKCPFCENGQTYISPTFVPDHLDGSDWTGFPLNISGTYEGGGYETCSNCSGTGWMYPREVPIHARPPEVKEAHRIKEEYKNEYLRTHPRPNRPYEPVAPKKPPSLKEFGLLMVGIVLIALLIEMFADVQHDSHLFILLFFIFIIGIEIWLYFSEKSTYSKAYNKWQEKEAEYMKKLEVFEREITEWQHQLDKHLSHFPKEIESIIEHWENPT